MKIICIGRNYPKHISELNNEKPTEPVVFIKPDTALLNKGFPFAIPDFSHQVEYEAELVVKINKVGKYISPKFAHKYYSQIGLGIDFTARGIQRKQSQMGLPWEIAKSFDNSAVVSDFIHIEELQNIDNIQFSLLKNNTVVQVGNSQDMIWKINELIAHISQYFTLKTGDLIFTGTPQGVGTVAPNDVLEGYIEDKKMFSINVI